jgi:hypothetical protein
VQENLEWGKTSKSQAINTMDTGDLFYRGSALEGLVPVEESTKDGSFSTLSLSPPITQGPASSSSSSQGSLTIPQGPPHSLVSLASFTSLQNFGGSSMGVKTPLANEHKDVAHTISQWISQGTSAKLKWVALSCLLSLLWHLCWL